MAMDEQQIPHGEVESEIDIRQRLENRILSSPAESRSPTATSKIQVPCGSASPGRAACVLPSSSSRAVSSWRRAHGHSSAG